MNHTDTDTQERETQTATREGNEERAGEERVTARPGVPFDAERARQAGLRSAERRRERKAEREAAAELDRLSVSGRVSTALAKEMSYAQVTAVIQALRTKAAEGSIQAIRELRSWLALAGIDGGADDGDAVPWAEMSAEQRASARAQLQRELAEIEEGAASADIP